MMMNRLGATIAVLPIGLAFFTVMSAPIVNLQDPHVHSRQTKDSKKIILETDLMYVMNTPQQFVQLGFVTSYPNNPSENPPEKINLMIWSFSREVLLRAVTLKVNTDGEDWSLSSQAYLVFKGETKNGMDVFWSERRPSLGEPSPLPLTARVRTTEGITGLFMEQVFANLKPHELAKIAQAKKVSIQMGPTKFELNDQYLSTIRDFHNRLRRSEEPSTAISTPEPANAPTSKGPIDLGMLNAKAINLPKPDYPASARGARASGTVNVLVLIDETGKVIAARAISGHRLLQPVSESAAKQARFKPILISGQPVKVSGIISYNFVTQ